MSASQIVYFHTASGTSCPQCEKTVTAVIFFLWIFLPSEVVGVPHSLLSFQVDVYLKVKVFDTFKHWLHCFRLVLARFSPARSPHSIVCELPPSVIWRDGSRIGSKRLQMSKKTASINKRDVYRNCLDYLHRYLVDLALVQEEVASFFSHFFYAFQWSFAF